MIGTRRYREHMYHDPVRREFAGETVPIPTAAVLARYRQIAKSRIIKTVNGIFAHHNPEKIPQLVAAADHVLAGVRSIPLGGRHRAELAGLVASEWSRIVPLSDADRSQLESSLAEYAFVFVTSAGKRPPTFARRLPR